jgi:hypothetical protein
MSERHLRAKRIAAQSPNVLPHNHLSTVVYANAPPVLVSPNVE